MVTGVAAGGITAVGVTADVGVAATGPLPVVIPNLNMIAVLGCNMRTIANFNLINRVRPGGINSNTARGDCADAKKRNQSTCKNLPPYVLLHDIDALINFRA